jgi:hypothetical protein
MAYAEPQIPSTAQDHHVDDLCDANHESNGGLRSSQSLTPFAKATPQRLGMVFVVNTPFGYLP